MNRDKKTIKTYFETGDVPTQQQYEDLIDSYIDSKQLPGEPNRRFVIDENGYVRVLPEIKQSNYSLSEINGNKIALLKDGVIINEIDLSVYIDNINLSRLVSGSLDANGIATFRRNDNSFFRVDFSPLINSDKLITKDLSSPEAVTKYWKGTNDQLANISAKNTDTLYFAKEEKTREFEPNILPVFPDNPSAVSIGDSYFSEDGKKLFISHTNNGREEYIIRELLLSTAYDISTAKLSGVELDLTSFKESNSGTLSRWSLSNDGTKLFFVDTQGSITFDDTLKVVNLKTPFDITTGTLDPNNKLALTQFGGAGYVFSPDGKQLIMRRDAGFFQYTLDNSFDLPTAKQVFYGQVSPILGTFGWAMGNPKFSNDGKRLFFPLTGRVGITEFHLTTPYDFSTATKKGELASRDVLGFVFNKDGTELSSITNPANITGTTSFNYQFNRYKLALPFDVLSTKGVGSIDMYLGDVKIDSAPKKDSYSLSISNDTNTVNLLENGSVISKIDLSSYIDDTNLARLTSGTVDANGIATFKRDDDSVFTVDFSILLDNVAIQISNSTGENQFSANKLQFDEFHSFNADKKEIGLNSQYLQLKTLTYLSSSFSGVLETNISTNEENINTLSQYNLGQIFRNPSTVNDRKIVFHLKNQYSTNFGRPFAQTGTIPPSKITVRGYLKPVNCKLKWNVEFDRVLFFEQTFEGAGLQKSLYVENIIIGKRDSLIDNIKSNYFVMDYKRYDSEGNKISTSQNQNYQVRTLTDEPMLLEDCEFYLFYAVQVEYDDATNSLGENMNFTATVSNDFLSIEIIK